MERVDYSTTETPVEYECMGCGATGCKLWRDEWYSPQLLCADCAETDQGMPISDTDQIGRYVPAVPTENGETYWDYISIPPAGYDWWDRLPTYPESQK